METTTTTTTTTTDPAPVMYLAHEHWSPRFETMFYTVKVEVAELFDSLVVCNDKIGGKTNVPAYYYRLDIYCGHKKHSIFRRYSQFLWLHQQLPSPKVGRGGGSSNDNDAKIVMPPTTCFCQLQDDRFAQNRMEQLREFLLEDILPRQEYASHPSVVTFLELDVFGT